MSWESEPAEKSMERDYGRYLYPGIGIIVCLLLAGLWWVGQQTTVDQTRARIQSIQINFNRTDQASRDEALETITELRQRIVDGESFSKLAKQYTDNKLTAPLGGNWGWVNRRDLVSEMGSFVWNGPVNELSPIIQGGTAYHLIYIHERDYSNAELHERELIKRSREEDAKESSP